MSKARELHIEAPDDAMCEILRGKTEAQRLAIAFGMWTFAREMIRANLRQEHPDWTGRCWIQEGSLRRDWR